MSRSPTGPGDSWKTRKDKPHLRARPPHGSERLAQNSWNGTRTSPAGSWKLAGVKGRTEETACGSPRGRANQYINAASHSRGQSDVVPKAPLVFISHRATGPDDEQTVEVCFRAAIWPRPLQEKKSYPGRARKEPVYGEFQICGIGLQHDLTV